MDANKRAYAVVKKAGKWTYYIVKRYAPKQLADGRWIWCYVNDVPGTEFRSADKSRRVAEGLGLTVNPGIGGLHNQEIQA